MTTGNDKEIRVTDGGDVTTVGGEDTGVIHGSHGVTRDLQGPRIIVFGGHHVYGVWAKLVSMTKLCSYDLHILILLSLGATQE